MRTIKHHRILKFFVMTCLTFAITMFGSGCEDDPLLDDNSSNKKQYGSYGKIYTKESENENNTDNAKVGKLNQHDETF